MNKKTVKNFLIASFGLIIFLGFSRFTLAANLNLICDNSGCELSPNPGASLFGEFEDLNYDVKPGDEISRRITVANEGDETCFLQVSSATVNLENPSDFSTKWYAAILEDSTDVFGTSSGGVALPGTTLNDVLTSTPLPLGSILSGQTKNFDWLIKFDPATGNAYQRARIEFDFDMTFECGEQPPETQLFIQKTNNRIGQVQEPGEDVVYTLIVTASSNNPVYNVYVTDLPPGGFTYRSGSWTASSDVRGNIKNTPTTEPTYASPGQWFLGDMQAGEIVTLTYVADISNTQESGIYPDLAWTEGTQNSDVSSSRVLGNLDTGVFVGTDVEIDVTQEYEDEDIEIDIEEVEIEGEVLGVSTLPATGADGIWIFAIFGLIGTGLMFLGISKILERQNSGGFGQHLAIIFGFIVSVFVFGSVVFAQPILVRLQIPEDPTHNQVLKLNFVALDTEQRAMTAKCFKQGPSDAGFVQLGADISIPAGGDSGYCTVPAGTLTESSTTKFYVEVKANGDISESAVVGVGFDDENPRRPDYIKKDKKSSCKNEIELRTANDGDTTRVEVYRSDKTEFDLSDAKEITDIGAGPDTKVTFDDEIPKCGKTYYYATRAFDDADNASDIRAETAVVEVTIEAEDTSVFGDITQAILVSDGSQAGILEEEPVSPDQELPIEVNPFDDTDIQEEGYVLGEQTQPGVFNTLLGLWPYVLFLVFAGIVYYRYNSSQDV